jgi:uncharacterized protein involved in outer membrane biogenesis
VQTTLLGLAIAIILALVAALVAPLVVDWNHYRAPIEAEASRLTGLSVRVNGPIDARLLPSPVITLNDVDVGEAGHPPQLRAGMLKLELALGPLLRGAVQASEVHVIGPQISLALDRSGAIGLPSLSPSFRPGALSISHFNVEDGRITLADAASGSRLVLEKLWFNGDIASLAGPFSGQGAVVVKDELYGYRISGNRADNGGTRIRLGIDPSDRPLTTELNGTLTFAQNVPQFDGTLTLARPVGATLANGQHVVSEPWRAVGTIRATPASASLQNLGFRYGPEERAVNFTGSADVTFGAHPQLVGKVAAMQVDVDRALAAPDVTDRPPLVVLRSFLQAFAGTAKLPIPARIGLAVDALTVGGTTIESLSGNLNFSGGAWTLDQFQFHAPGLTEVNVSGRLTGTAQGFVFSGPAALTSTNFETLLAWLDGRGGGRVSAVAKTLQAHGDVTIASDRVAIERLNAALDRESIEGRLAYDWPADNRPARLDAELRAAALNLDALWTFAKSAAGGDGLVLPQEVKLALDIDKATFAGVDAQAVNADLKFDAGKLQIDRLSIGDLAGAKLDMSGRIDELSSQPRGQMTLDLDARALDGLSGIAAKFMPQQADWLRHAAARLAPAKVHAVLDVERGTSTGSTADLHMSGTLAAMRLAIAGKASGEPAHPSAAAVQADSQLEADDGSALTALLGLDRLLAVDQLPGRLTLSVTGPLDGDIHVDGKVAASGLDSTIGGTLRLSGERTPSGHLQIEAVAGDLRPLHQAMTGQPGIAVPIKAHAAVGIDGAKLAFSDIAASVGKASLHGHVALDWANPIGIDGEVTADEVDGASVMAMLLGLPSSAQAAGTPWSSERLGAGAFAAMNGAVTFRFARADFAPTLIAHDLKGVVRFRPSAIAVDDIDGSVADGRVAASLKFQRNADGLAAHAKLDLADVAAATIVGPDLNVTDGRLTMTLASDGFGATPMSLFGSLHGGGTVTLKDARFAGLDAAAFDAARQAAGQSGQIDMGKVQAAVNAALASGHFAVPQGDASVTIASGALNLNHVTLQGKDGAQLSLDGAVDLVNAAIDARMTLSKAPPASALIRMRPELSINIKGPLAAPQRTLDISALTSWLTLSAAELQTRRIESMEANQHEGAADQGVRPDAADGRAVSPGGVVEFTTPPPSGLGPGARGIERLQQPTAPPAIPEQNRPGSGGAARGAAASAPGPLAIRPPRQRKNTANAAAPEQTHPPPAPQSGGAAIPNTD